MNYLKQKLLLTVAALLGGVISVSAQTDVTSTYITNADFEGDYQRFLDINSDRGVEKPVGWSVEWSQTATNDQNGMTYVGSMNQDSQNWTAHGGDKAYFTRMRWANATLNLRQTMSNLRPGSYTLSFYATASKLNDGNGSASVSVAGQSQTITVGTSTGTSWTQYKINFTVTTNPYATIEVTASRTAGNFKFGIDDFTLTYDGSSYYSTILTAAQSLYDDNADWAENGLSDLSAAITAATGKETVADKNAAIVALEEAMATFKEANSVDMTSRITNATFDSNISGWTTTGGDGNAFQRQTSSQTNFNGGFLEKWRNGWNGGYNQKNFDVYQTLSSLPKGEYTIKAAIIAVMQGDKEVFAKDKTAYSNKKHGGPYYIDDEKGVWLYGTSGETTAKAWANTKNSSFDGDGAEYKTATISVTNGSLTIGFKGIGSADGGTALGTYANWIACDNWTLSYFGFDPSTLKAQISGLKDDVQAIIDGDEVPNAVKSSLQNTLDNLVETPETKSVLDAAVSTLEGAIEAANATKAPYAKVKALISLATDEKDNSTGDKTAFATAISTATTNIELRTTAAALDEDYNTLEEARETYVTGGAQPTPGNVFDFTFKINDAAVTGTSAWGTARTGSGEQYTGAPDNTYLDCGWAQTYNMNQNVASLPAGSYTLKAATRAKSSEVTEANIYVNQTNSALNKSTNNHRDNNTGGELGNGWSWSNVDFVVLKAGAVTVGFYAQTTGQGWAGADDFHLYYNGTAPMYKEALFDVMTSANTLYNSGANVGTGVFQIPEAAGTAFSEAIDDANDVYDDTDASASEITEAITALETAIETFKAAELNAPADGARYYLKVATSGHAKENNAIVVSLGATSANNPTGYGFAANASPAAHIAGAYIFTKVEGKSNTYYISVVRPEGTVYLTYGSLNGSAAGWKTQQIQGTTNAENKGEFKIVATSTANVFNIVNTVFEDADNYIDCQDGGSLYTDTNIEMKDFSLAEASQASVTVSCKAGKYGTVIFPFTPDVSSGFGGITFYSAESVNGATQKVQITEVAEPVANVPYLIKNDNGEDFSRDVTGWGTATADSYTAGLLKGVFVDEAIIPASTETTANYVLQTPTSGENVGEQAFYKVASDFTATAYKCYLTVNSGSGAHMLKLFFDEDETTGISSLTPNPSPESEGSKIIYDLQGRKVQNPKRGMYIINGKVVVVK